MNQNFNNPPPPNYQQQPGQYGPPGQPINLKNFKPTTDPTTKILIILFVGLLPMLLAWIFFRVPSIEGDAYYDIWMKSQPLVTLSSYGIYWAISMAIFTVNIIFFFTVIRPFNTKSKVKMDVVGPTLGLTWMLISYYTLPWIGWWRLLVGFLFYLVFSIMTVIIGYIIIVLIAAKKFNKMVEKGASAFEETFKGMDPQFADQMKKMFNEKHNKTPQQKQQNQALYKKNLDDKLKQQGIDVESLDKEWGTSFDDDDDDDKPSEENFIDIEEKENPSIEKDTTKNQKPKSPKK